MFDYYLVDIVDGKLYGVVCGYNSVAYDDGYLRSGILKSSYQILRNTDPRIVEWLEELKENTPIWHPNGL